MMAVARTQRGSVGVPGVLTPEGEKEEEAESSRPVDGVATTEKTTTTGEEAWWRRRRRRGCHPPKMALVSTRGAGPSRGGRIPGAKAHDHLRDDAQRVPA
jgi:hypothetical protein